MITKRLLFSNSVVRELKYYVYIYSNPITNEIFYVGKGKENRVFSHLNDALESKKVAYISDLRSKGLEPKIEILIHGLDDDITALRVEAAIIDLIGINDLANQKGGYKSALYGRMSIEQINSAYNKQRVDIIEPSILIRINQAFRYSMSEMELYDYTRGQWKIQPNIAKEAKYGFAIYKGIVQEVYEILNWYEAGKTLNVRKNFKYIERADDAIEGRYEFIGNIAPDEIRNKYKYKSVEHYFQKGNSNPILYLNFK